MPPFGRINAPALAIFKGSINQARDPGPYTSPGRTMVQSISPAAWLASTTCSLAPLATP
ncbi:hypothetical protein D3C78_1726490 [compost metagenome]